MWRNENRGRYDRSRLRYPSDLTDEEWGLTEPLIPPSKRGGNRRTVVVRDVVDGVMCMRPSKTWGCTFRLCGDRLECGMRWRVMLELVGEDGTVSVRELGGGAPVAEYAPQTIGLTLAEGKQILAETQRHRVQAQTEDHCRRRRVCQRCQARRPLKDRRSRRLVSLFGTVAVKAPRFKPCQCAVTSRARSAGCRKSCPIDARPNTSGSWRKWGR